MLETALLAPAKHHATRYGSLLSARRWARKPEQDEGTDESPSRRPPRDAMWKQAPPNRRAPTIPARTLILVKNHQLPTEDAHFRSEIGAPFVDLNLTLSHTSEQGLKGSFSLTGA